MATESFHNILHTIQTCGLNFKMEITSFSATIVVKNSLTKDKNALDTVLVLCLCFDKLNTKTNHDLFH